MEKTRQYYLLLDELGMGERVPLPTEEKRERQERLKKNLSDPPDYLYCDGEVMRIRELAMSGEEFHKICAMKQLSAILTIKKGVVFFVAVAVVSLVFSLVALLGNAH